MLPRSVICSCTLSITIPYVFAEILGPTVPAPIDLSSDESLVRAAWDNLTQTLDSFLHSPTNDTKAADLVNANNLTWSAGVFSLHDTAAAEKLQFHWTSPEVANTVNGTHKVDGDSIYRAASISKLITSLAGLINLSPEQWNTPISKLIPGLGEGGNVENPSSPSQWDTITPWALANQQSGVTTIGLPGSDLIASFLLATLKTNTTLESVETANGFPPEQPSTLGPCSHSYAIPNCPLDDFLSSVKGLHPNLLPWTTPAYSDFGLMLLGLAISNSTGKSYQQMYQGSIFGPLNMSSSYISAPRAGSEFDRSVIVGPDLVEGGFDVPGPLISMPSGGVLTTVNDLAKLGIGLLNHSLLSPLVTRQWMKPHGHTASLSYSLGAPWEIVRFVHPDTGKVTDIYSKLGDSGNYGGLLAVIPDYNAGFSFLNAATIANRGSVALKVISRIAESLVPALEAQALAESKKNYVGEYTCDEGGPNSSVVISFDENTIAGATSPALTISRWVSNSTDMLEQLTRGVKPQLQLYVPKQDDGPGPVAFQYSTVPQYKTYMDAKLGPWSGFYDSNYGWASMDHTRYAGVAASMLVFDVNAAGKAEAVRTPSTQMKFRRKDDRDAVGEP